MSAFTRDWPPGSAIPGWSMPGWDDCVFRSPIQSKRLCNVTQEEIGLAVVLVTLRTAPAILPISCCHCGFLNGADVKVRQVSDSNWIFRGKTWLCVRPLKIVPFDGLRCEDDTCFFSLSLMILICLT